MPQSIRVIAVSVAAATVCSLAVLAVAGAGRQTLLLTAPVASSPISAVAPGVIASGDATVSRRPDIAYLYVGIDSQRQSAAAAQTDLANKAARLISRAKALGVADTDISTSSYSIGPTYSPGNQALTGYTASEQLQLKWHDVDTVGRTLDALVQQGGATQIGVGFGLADPKQAQAEARALAIADARTKALAMAAAAGVKLGQLLLVSDLTSPSYPRSAYALAAGAPATSSQLPVGQLDVSVTVELDFALG